MCKFSHTFTVEYVTKQRLFVSEAHSFDKIVAMDKLTEL